MIFYNSFVAHKEASFGGYTGKVAPDEKSCSRCFKKTRSYGIFDVRPKKDVLCLGTECKCWHWMVHTLAVIPDYLEALGRMRDDEESLPPVKKEKLPEQENVLDL